MIVAEVTSKVRSIASEVMLSPADGVQVRSAINLHHVHSIRKEQIGKLITCLRKDKMNEIRSALLFALGFEE